MTHAVRLREEADQDLAAAATWYEMHRPGLGRQFLDEAARTIRRIAENPFKYPVMWRQTHRALMHRFPFGIYFRVRGDTAVVVAVMHGSRDPRNWQWRP